jgi:hypothetical protein
VIDGWVCLAGVRETDHLVPLGEHPNRQAIARTVRCATHVAGRLPLTHDEAAIAQGALSAAQRAFDASPQDRAAHPEGRMGEDGSRGRR